MSYELILDDTRLQELLARGAAAGADYTRPFQALRIKIEGEAKRQFETAGASGGEPWAPLAPSTVKRRPSTRQNPGGNKGGVGHPLWNTGRAKASLQGPGPDAIIDVRPLELTRGTARPAFHFHQTGTRYMPARPMFTRAITDRVTVEAVRLITAHLTGGR